MSEQQLPRRVSGLPPEALEPTGDAAVDSALADLQSIDPDLDPAEQLPVLLAVHEALQQRLSSTEA